MQARARGYVLTLGAAHAWRWRCTVSHSAFSERRAAQYARSWKYAPPCSSVQILATAFSGCTYKIMTPCMHASVSHSVLTQLLFGFLPGCTTI